MGRGLLAGGSGPASILQPPLENKTNRKLDKVLLKYCMLQNRTKYICTWCILQAKFQKQTMPRCRQCVNSVPRRMSGAHAPRSAIPHVSRPGCEPARCVHRAASGSRRPGVTNATTRTQIRARVGCRARTHALAGGVQMGRRGFLFAALRAASSLPGSRPHFWRRTGGRRITVRRPLLPRVIRWGIHR